MSMQTDAPDVPIRSRADAFELPELAGEAARQASDDLASIARGEELDITWRRLRTLLDYDLVVITSRAILGGSLRGSRTTIGWTNEGTRFMSCKTPL